MNVAWQGVPAHVWEHTTLYSIISTDNADLIVGAELTPYTEVKVNKTQVGTRHTIERVPNADTISRYEELVAAQKARGIVGPTGLYLDAANSHDEIVEIPVFEESVQAVGSDKKRGTPIRVGDTVNVRGRTGVLESLNPLIVDGTVYRWSLNTVVTRA